MLTVLILWFSSVLTIKVPASKDEVNPDLCLLTVCVNARRKSVRLCVCVWAGRFKEGLTCGGGNISGGR